MEVTVPCHEVWKRCVTRRQPEAAGIRHRMGDDLMSVIFHPHGTALSRRGSVPAVLCVRQVSRQNLCLEV